MLGIDPGKNGAIALVSNDPQTLLWWLLSDVDGNALTPFDELIATFKPQHAYIEKCQSFPGNKASAMLNYGTGFGKILGWCEMLKLPYTLVAPVTWTKAMHKGCVGKDGKAKSLQAAQRLFPGENMIVGRSKKPHDGVVDALLIAEYGRRIFN